MASSSGALSPKLKVADLTGKVAIITGATRGIGKACAIALAKQGCNIVVAAKTTTEQPTLPGTIYSVAEELQQLGVQALPVKVDLRKLEDIKECVKQTVDKFGRIDILINNASALWWQRIEDTPMNKYDLITQINTRGSFAMTHLCLPIMAKNKYGRVINMSPPLQTDFRAYKGFTAYNISKFGMTMSALGAAAEYEGQGITGNSLWPATVIESQASKNFELGGREMWRKDNMMLTAKGHLKLLDFGLSAPPSRKGECAPEICGTPAYMAPESFEGISQTKTDIWAIGIITYECLTGSLPFDQDESYEDFAHRIGHIEEQYTRIEDILPSKLDIAYDLQSVLGATAVKFNKARHFIEGVLCSNSDERLSLRRCRKEAFFEHLDFGYLHRMKPPIKIQVASDTDVEYFDVLPPMDLPRPQQITASDANLDWAGYSVDAEFHKATRR